MSDLFAYLILTPLCLFSRASYFMPVCPHLSSLKIPPGKRSYARTVCARSVLQNTPSKYVLSCTVLYCTTLCCTVLHCTVLHCTVLYCSVLHCTTQYCTTLYCALLYCNVLYPTVVYRTVLLLNYREWKCTRLTEVMLIEWGEFPVESILR